MLASRRIATRRPSACRTWTAAGLAPRNGPAVERQPAVPALTDGDEPEARGGLVLEQIGLERGRDHGRLGHAGPPGMPVDPVEEVRVGEDRGSSDGRHMTTYIPRWRPTDCGPTIC